MQIVGSISIAHMSALLHCMEYELAQHIAVKVEEEEEEEFLGLKPPNNEIKYIIKSIELFILMSSHSFNFM